MYKTLEPMKESPNKRTVILTLAVIAILLMASGFLIYDFHFKDNDKRTNAQKAIQSVVDIKCTEGMISSLGTGFIIENNGKKIITNAHIVVYESTGTEYTYGTIECKFYNSTETYALNVISYDRDIDVAVLEFKDTPPDVPALKLGNSNKLQYGQYVYTIGNGMGYGLAFTAGHVSVPLVKVIAPDGRERLAIQTSLLINGGNSGGPLLTENNEVVGIVAFRLNDGGGNTIIGMGFAIPSNLVSEHLKTL
jgi:S1-C subfamily serine protease